MDYPVHLHVGHVKVTICKNVMHVIDQEDIVDGTDDDDDDDDDDL